VGTYYFSIQAAADSGPLSTPARDLQWAALPTASAR